MDAGRREQIIAAIEAWCMQHLQQPWAWVVTLRARATAANEPATYEAWVEVPTTPDWITVVVTCEGNGMHFALDEEHDRAGQPFVVPTGTARTDPMTSVVPLERPFRQAA